MLYRLEKPNCEFRFCEIKNEIIQNDKMISWVAINQNNMLLFIKKFYFTESTAVTQLAGATVLKIYIATRVHNNLLYDNSDWDKAVNEWNKNQRISGNMFLTSNEKMIWISDIDLKYFTRID